MRSLPPAPRVAPRERLPTAFPSGSHLVVSHSTNVVDPEDMNEAARLWNEGGSTPLALRSPERIAELFSGLEIVEPGVESCPLWRPDELDVGAVRPMDGYCVVGRHA